MLSLRLFRRAYCTSRRDSPLHVPNSEKMTNVVIPDLDLKERLAKCENLNVNLTRRGLPELNRNVEILSKGLDNVAHLKKQVANVLDLREATRLELQELKKKGPAKQEELNAKQKELEELKKEFLMLRDTTAALDKDVTLSILDLPNAIHASVGDQDEIVFQSPPTVGLRDFLPKPHPELAGEELEFSDNSHTAFYLFNRLAKLELDLGSKCLAFLKNLKYEAMSCPDFYKSVVLDGCAVNFRDLGSEFALKSVKEFGNRDSGQGMHLTGGASLYAMVSFFSKNVVRTPDRLPRSFVSLGRRYRPVPHRPEPSSLFHTQQSNAVQTFSIYAKQRESEKAYEKALLEMKTFYSKLGVPFRAVNKAAKNLAPAESKRVSFELFSAGENDFIPVGSLSLYGKYLSNRLMIKEDRKNNLNSLFSYGGCFMDITKAIGCIVEHNQDSEGNYSTDCGL